VSWSKTSSSCGRDRIRHHQVFHRNQGVQFGDINFIRYNRRQHSRSEVGPQYLLHFEARCDLCMSKWEPLDNTRRPLLDRSGGAAGRAAGGSAGRAAGRCFFLEHSESFFDSLHVVKYHARVFVVAGFPF
jgi:hypothetical protein